VDELEQGLKSILVFKLEPNKKSHTVGIGKELFQNIDLRNKDEDYNICLGSEVY